MRIFLMILCLFLSFSKGVQAQDGTFNLMIFGDSLSAGYKLSAEDSFYSQLQKTLLDKGYDNVKVINASVVGDTTQRGLDRIDRALAQNPHAVLLELGINDMLQGASLATTRSNLEKIIGTFQDNNVSVMLVGMMAPPQASYEGRTEFTQMYKDLAKKYDLTFYPFFMEGVIKQTFGVYSTKYLLDDGAHPNAQGVQIMVKNIYPTVEKFLLNQ